MKDNAIVAEGIAICLLVFLFDYIFGTKLPEKDFGTIMIVIGCAWLVGSVFCAGMKPVENTIITLFLSILLIAVGGSTSTFEDATYSHTQDEMGQTQQAEWQIIVRFKNSSGFNDSKTFEITGDTSKANLAAEALKWKWNEEHPQNPATEVEKILCYIPADYAKKHDYPMELTKRY